MYRFLAVLLLALLGGLIYLGAHFRTPDHKEADEMVTQFLSATFKSVNEDWYAADRLPVPGAGQWVLVELHHPKSILKVETVTDTEQMNGIEARYRLIIECDQYRTWRNGNWTLWQPGTGGKAALYSSIGIELNGFAVITFEKAHGAWTTTNALASRNLSQDPSLVAAMVAQTRA